MKPVVLLDRTLLIIRGLPGSGKSYIGSCIARFNCAEHYEADMYMMNLDGVYEWKSELLKYAHNWCYNSCKISMQQYNTPVVVSNTSTRVGEFIQYVQLAEKLGWDVIVMRVVGDFGSTHNVPEEVIKMMRDGFEDYPGEIVYANTP